MKLKHLTRAEEVVITRLRIGHTKVTKSHILSWGPPTACQHCGTTLTIEQMLLECTVLQQIRDEYYTTESLRTLFETIPEACIVEFLREAGLFYLIWKAIYSMQQIIEITDQLTKFGSYINRYTLTTPLHSVIRLQSINSWENPTCERRLMCLWGRVSSLNKYNPIQYIAIDREEIDYIHSHDGQTIIVASRMPHSSSRKVVKIQLTPLDSKAQEPTWGPPEADRNQLSSILAPWSLLSGSSF